jgi:hypothetical protein
MAPGAAGAAQAQMLMRAMGQGQAPAVAGAVPAGFPHGMMATPGAPAATVAPTMAGGQALAPKKPGLIRIGVLEPKAQMGAGNASGNVPEAIRTTLIQYLSGPMIEVTPITAKLAMQIDAEIQQKECDLVLYTSISQKLNSGGMGMLKKAMPMASMIPMVGLAGGMAGAAAAAGGAATTAAGGLAGVANNVKAKAEVTFEYKLVAPGSANVSLANTATAKAKADGEDIVTPLIEQAATAILTHTTTK